MGDNMALVSIIFGILAFGTLGLTLFAFADVVTVDGIDTQDYPDFVDAYIESADYKGREMTEEELDFLNEDSDFVYEEVQKHLF